MIFQASDYKGSNFLDWIGDDFLSTKLTYTKDSTWLNYFGHSNTLYACATRAITNHTSIGEYHFRFFPRKMFKYLCRNYPIKSRHYILHDYRRYDKFWNSNKELLKKNLYFWNLTQEHFPSIKKLPNNGITVLSYLFLPYYLSIYVMDTIVYYQVLCNKLLIFL